MNVTEKRDEEGNQVKDEERNQVWFVPPREFKAEYDKHRHNFDDQSTFSHHAVRG